MKIIIKATNFTLTPSVQGAVEEKLGSIAKFIPKETLPLELRVEVALISHKHTSGDIFRTEANLRIHSNVLRTEAQGKDIFEAINQAKDNLQRLVEKYKGRHPDKALKISQASGDLKKLF